MFTSRVHIYTGRETFSKKKEDIYSFVTIQKQTNVVYTDIKRTTDFCTNIVSIYVYVTD